MTCAQNRPLPKYADAVSETCEAAMWKFKFDLTRDVEHGMANRIEKVTKFVLKYYHNIFCNILEASI